MEHTAYSVFTSGELIRMAMQRDDTLTRELAIRLERGETLPLSFVEYAREHAALAAVQVSA
jgi:hypothetical protein